MSVQEIRANKLKVVKALNLKVGQYVVIPQHPNGILLVRKVDDVEIIDDGKWIEVTTEDGLIHLVSPDDRVIVVLDTGSKGVKTKRMKQSITVEEGMDRLANFIENTHGAQDWENTVYNLQDYLAAFIGAKGKEMYQDLMERLEDIKAK